MDRRTFLGSAFGLVALAAGVGIASTATKASEDSYFVTTEGVSADAAVGPAMMPGISLVREGDVTRGMADDVHLFDVDSIGAELIERANGVLTLDQLAATTSVPVNAADVASFFVSLGQAGYLQNEVLVNLTQTTA